MCLLPIVGADIILGANWLATLGPHIADYSIRTLEFFYNKKLIILKGETQLKPNRTTIPQLHRLCSTHAITSCYTLTVATLLELGAYTQQTLPA